MDRYQIDAGARRRRAKRAENPRGGGSQEKRRLTGPELHAGEQECCFQEIEDSIMILSKGDELCRLHAAELSRSLSTSYRFLGEKGKRLEKRLQWHQEWKRVLVGNKRSDSRTETTGGAEATAWRLTRKEMAACKRRVSREIKQEVEKVETLVK